MTIGTSTDARTIIGMDIHRSSSTVVWENPALEIRGRCCISTTPEAFGKLLNSLPRPWVIAYEATRQAPMVSKLLRDLEVDEQRLVHPRAVETLLALDKANTDSKAAHKIMTLLRDLQSFPEAYLAPVAVQDAREISRGRQYLKQIGTGLQNYLRSLLNKAGLNCKGTRLLSKKGRAQMPELISQLEPFAAIIGTMMWELLQLVDSHCEALDNLMKQELCNHPAGPALLKLPGVGVATAYGIIAEIGEIKRFPSCRRLNSYAGMVPRIHQSDKFYQVGHLSQDCNKHLRYYAICAAQAATRCKTPSKAKETYDRVKRGEPKRACLAKIAAARKLLVDIFWTWNEAIA